MADSTPEPAGEPAGSPDLPPLAGDLASSRRRFAAGSAAGGVISVVAFFWMVTNGTGRLFQSGLNTNFYDAQARALMAGHWWMSPGVLSIEGIVIHGRTYMYYGPFPAVLRMPILLVTHGLDGQLTALSMLLAFTVAVLFIGRLSWTIRLLADAERPVSRREAVLAGLLVVLLGAGSALMFLGSDTIIYHEAELWGAALALGALDFVVRFVARPRARSAIGAGVFATLAMLTRGSVGAAPVVALGLLAAVAAVAVLRRRVAPKHASPTGVVERLAGLDDAPIGAGTIAVLVACALVPVAAYAAVNEAKFGTLFSLPLNHQVETMISAHRRAVLAANGGSLFGLKFVPTALLAYFRPDGIAVVRLFPFVMFPTAATVLGHLRYDDRDWAASLTATMPLVFLLGVAGVVAILWRRQPVQRTRRLRIPVVGALAGTAGVLEIAFIANRYLADFMPLAVLVSLAGAHALAGRARRARRRWPWRTATALLAAIGLAGVVANTGLSLVYQRELRPAIPLSERAGFVAFQQQLDESLFGNPPAHVIRPIGLVHHAPAGTLAIIGNCSGLYESAGIMSGWDAVERATSDGHFRLRLRFPSDPAATARHPGPWWPVVDNGVAKAASWLALRAVGREEFQFGYLFEGAGESFSTGSPFAERPGSTHLVDAVLDHYVQEVTASVDGTVEFELGYFVRANRPVHLGVNPFGGGVTERFPGGVETEPVPTPICDSLARRLRRR